MSIPKRSAKAIAFASLIFLSTTYSFAEDSATEAASAPMTEKLPIPIAKSFLEGKGLVPLDPNEAADEGVTVETPITSSTHLFHAGKISSYVFDVSAGRVRIDGLPYDEFVQILEGRLILTPDEGEEMEFKKGDYLIVPEGYTGYWTMPEQYREFVIVNTIPEPTDAEENATEGASTPMTEKLPIPLAKSFLEGEGLVPMDPNEGADEGVQTEGPISSSTHMFHAGKISAYVFDVSPGRVRIDGLPYDEFVQILEGRLILTPDEGEEMEFKKGDYLIVPEGYTGYWTMPEQYREFVIINTIPEPSE